MIKSTAPRKKGGCFDWEKMIAGRADRPIGVEPGAPDRGFTAQTANGTAHATGAGWNKVVDYEMSQLPPDQTRPAGRNNRTGE